MGRNILNNFLHHRHEEELPAPVTLLEATDSRGLMEQDTDNPLPVAIPAASIDENTRTLLLRECDWQRMGSKNTW